MKTVGIIGCGMIGTLIAEAIEKGTISCDKLILYDLDSVRAENLKEKCPCAYTHTHVIVAKNIEEMLELKPTVIVESASQNAVMEYMRRIITDKIDLIILSTGALLDMDRRNSKIHIPAGAIGGLDAISSASFAGVEEAILVTRKNPRVLGIQNREEKLLFEGVAEEAVQRFPKEMNVAATLALAVKPAKVIVKVISDPKVNQIIHEIKVKWKHGVMSLKFANDTYPKSPRTSVLAVWSAIRSIKDILEK